MNPVTRVRALLVRVGVLADPTRSTKAIVIIGQPVSATPDVWHSTSPESFEISVMKNGVRPGFVAATFVREGDALAFAACCNLASLMVFVFERDSAGQEWATNRVETARISRLIADF